MMRILRYLVPAGILLLWCLAAPALAKAGPKACGREVYEELRAPASAGTAPVSIACDLTLAATDVISMPIVYSGSAASGSRLDCHGATLDGTVPAALAVLIESVRRHDGSWDRPVDITIRNCIIKGEINIRGLGRNGEAELVRQSSLTAGHTARAQAAAPSRIRLENITFVAQRNIPLYAGPGVTELTVEKSTFTGTSRSVGLYLDAESARNRILANLFDLRTLWREQLAVDGSAENRIEDNRFENPVSGGIFLYRNCGEGGTIRHQAPQHNIIANNIFHYRDVAGARPAIWLGSRQGNRFYCFSRPRAAFGSGLSADDEAQYNTVTGNGLLGGEPNLILDQDENNIVSGNR
ncbi:right-handed parallel beta-helix repeat-containing protein [Rhizobium deserti]|uniref:Right-handed parallel beta-helix repeat-containing protein n=1 Tax=Rhizobium deserti TaxID=2547961 RepID=A0A4R5UHF2_9HYPH|nr:right-handed parallel beta-helix repeat-containing protein [Rhizobium deserti]TDK35390.1 right-handed parallel beta-helix repeat-containing protein [Rhizobium deserti]